MTAGETKLLFSWNDVDQLPDLRRLTLVLGHLPDGPVLEALTARRGCGRNDYPVGADVAGGGRGGCSSARVHRVLVARTRAQSGPARGVRIRSVAAARQAAPVDRGTCRDGRGDGD